MNTIILTVLLQLFFMSIAFAGQVEFDFRYTANHTANYQEILPSYKANRLSDANGKLDYLKFFRSTENYCTKRAISGLDEMSKDKTTLEKLKGFEKYGKMKIVAGTQSTFSRRKNGDENINEDLKLSIVFEDLGMTYDLEKRDGDLQLRETKEYISSIDKNSAATFNSRRFYAPSNNTCRRLEPMLDQLIAKVSVKELDAAKAKMSDAGKLLDASLQTIKLASDQSQASLRAIQALAGADSRGSNIDRNADTSASAQSINDYSKMAAEAFAKTRDFWFPEDEGRTASGSARKGSK